MSKPLTMTVEREAWIREHGTGVTPQSWQPGVTMLRDVLAEVDALRAALAAAEARLAEANEQIRLDALNEDTLRRSLADERRHADALDAALRDPDNITVERARAAHAARRAAEVE